MNNYAVSSDGIATALQDSASALMEGGANLEQATALVAAANKVIQDPSSVGSALRTISLRLRGTSVEILEEMGEETDGVVESTSKLQEKLKALTGVDILTDAGEYKDVYTILKEIGSVWQDLEELDKAAALELMAGKNRANTLSAILNNMEDLEGAYESALEAEGSALRENEKYLSSIQGRIDLFTNSLQTMWMNAIDSDFVKFIVDLGTAAIQLVDTLGLIPTIIGAFTGFNAIKSIIKVDDFKTIAEWTKELIKSEGTLTTESQKVIASLMAEDAAAKLRNSSLVQYAITSEIVTDKQVANMTTTELLGTAFVGLAAKVKAATVAMAKFLFTTPAGWAVVAAAAITSTMVAYNAFGPTHENHLERLEEETEKLKNIQSELKSVSDELETTRDRIDELNSKGTLSFVEQEELDRLKEQTIELERQEKILQAQEKRSRKKQIEAALSAAETDSDLKAKTVVSTQSIPSYAAALQSTETQFYGYSYAAALQDTVVRTSTSNQYESNLEALKKAKEDLEKAKIELGNTTYDAESAEYKALEKQVNDAQSRVDKFNNAIDSMNDAWETKYGEIGYIENATDEVEKQWNEFYRQHQDYLDQQALINDVYGKSTVLDRVFGDTGTDVAKEFKNRFESEVKNGKDPNDVIEELLSMSGYSSSFGDLENKFGVTLDNIKDYFTQTGEFASQVLTEATFNMADYANSIDSIQDNISTFQNALTSLEDGTFTYSDFIDLTQQFPDLAEGVDTSTKSFNGLAKNLRKAIKASPDDLVGELKDLRKQLQESGKSTTEIDQLISSIENLPVEAVQNLSDEYVTLADEINAAKKAQNELQEAMSENPNEGYETRGEAMEYMKDKMSRGEIGSESELWDVAEKYGFTYDSAKSINENADALAKFIAIREEWFAQNDDGEYTFTGTEEFIQDVENAVNSNKRLKEILQWDYNEETGAFSFDFDNANWDEIVKLLSQSEELAGLTSEEFHDMLVQIGQYFGLNWEDYKDVEKHLNTIASSAADAKTKVEEYGEAMQAGLGKDTKIDLTNRPRIDTGDGHYETVDSRAYSNEDETVTITVTPILPDGTKLTDEELEKYTVDIINGADPATYEFEVNGKTYTGDDIVLGKHYGEDSIEQANEFGQALHNAQEEYYALVDEMKSNPFSIKYDGDVETDIITPLKEAGLEVDEVIDEAGNKQFTFDVVNLETLMRNNGYTTKNVMDVINRIFGEGSDESKLVGLREDILNIGYITSGVLDTLDEIGASYDFSASSQGARITIDSNIDELLRNLHFTDTEIEALKKKWEENGIYVRADVTEVESSQETLDDQPENVTTTVDLNADSFHKKIAPVFDDLDELTRPRTATVTINTTTKETVVKEEKYVPAVKSNSNSSQNMINVNGTAHAQGSWGVKETGTSLVGELGPELV